MWGQAQNDCEHSANVKVVPDLDRLRIRVVRKESGAIVSAPVVADVMIFCYVAGGPGLVLAAVNIEAGDRVWEMPIGVFSAGYRVAGAIDGFRLFYFDERGLALIDCNSRRELARMENSDEWFATSPPALAANRAFFHDHGGRLWAVDSETLETRWSVVRRGMISYAPPAVSEKTLVAQWVKAGGSCVAGLDVETGECNWELEYSELTRGTCTLVGDCAFLPLFHEDTVLGLDVESGDVLWQRRVEAWPGRPHMDHVGFCVADQKLIHGMSPSYYEALDQATGDTVWRFKTTSPCPSHPIAGEGWVLFVALDGTVSWLATDSGDLLARCSVKERILHAPAMTDRGLFLVSESGTIWCVS